MQEARKLQKEMRLKAKTESEDTNKGSALWRRAAVYAAILVLVFLLGFVPARLSERETVRQRNAAQAHLRLSQLQNRLATAAISARRGEYEPARLATSDFFTDLRAEIDRPQSAFSDGQREAVRPILDERDRLIALLARNDGAAIERLADLYVNYTRAINPSALARR
jgi:hypothetical protein